MSNLVQRLREWASEPACYEVPPSSLLRDAAEEIERLRGTLELIAAPQRPDGTWNRDRRACQALAAEALNRETK